jgi:hypothetical protein
MNVKIMFLRLTTITIIPTSIKPHFFEILLEIAMEKGAAIMEPVTRPKIMYQ